MKSRPNVIRIYLAVVLLLVAVLVPHHHHDDGTPCFAFDGAQAALMHADAHSAESDAPQGERSTCQLHFFMQKQVAQRLTASTWTWMPAFLQGQVGFDFTPLMIDRPGLTLCAAPDFLRVSPAVKPIQRRGPPACAC